MSRLDKITKVVKEYMATSIDKNDMANVDCVASGDVAYLLSKSSSKRTRALIWAAFCAGRVFELTVEKEGSAGSAGSEKN